MPAVRVLLYSYQLSLTFRPAKVTYSWAILLLLQLWNSFFNFLKCCNRYFFFFPPPLCDNVSHNPFHRRRLASQRGAGECNQASVRSCRCIFNRPCKSSQVTVMGFWDCVSKFQTAIAMSYSDASMLSGILLDFRYLWGSEEKIRRWWTSLQLNAAALKDRDKNVSALLHVYV